MKLLRALRAGAALLAAAPASLSAQDGPPRRLMRGDISGTVGWVNTNKSEFSSYNDWHGQGEASLALGWYWTDHHKTEVEVGTTTETSFHTSTPWVYTGCSNVRAEAADVLVPARRGDSALPVPAQRVGSPFCRCRHRPGPRA